MKWQFERLWQRWNDTVKFFLWGLTMALVCFLLYRLIVNDDTTHLVPLSESGRDSLMAVGLPTGVSDTLVRYDGTIERADQFAQDPGVKGCPEPADYAGCGMDRGHLVPAADLKWNETAMRQSFLLTNVGPMHKALNEGGWSKLEEKVREWTDRDSALLVFSGPVIGNGDTTLASGRVRVPSAYYKIIMAPCVRPQRVIAFIYPNGYSDGRLREYAVSVDEVEQRTGLDFFPTLPQAEQERLESRVNLEAWTN